MSEAPFSAMSWLCCKGIYIIGKEGRDSQVAFPTSRLGLFVHGNKVSQAIVNARAQIEVATATKPLLRLKTVTFLLIIIACFGHYIWIEI